ncbi:hypothetical protein BO71DRAFT_4730 [Aspergillus ellipticus CBS 707.79]|uniref:Uncharacterized protein n=1 Tax=Aspergillus ellipticus CBS 707.79 TaxID=1448320 RepID=A0A319D7R7_9EURO|nr:hypothetical protein BO71DRAFT_4730 [Aspergillus ellipticus CBS 707.79]
MCLVFAARETSSQSGLHGRRSRPTYLAAYYLGNAWIRIWEVGKGMYVVCMLLLWWLCGYVATCRIRTVCICTTMYVSMCFGLLSV